MGVTTRMGSGATERDRAGGGERKRWRTACLTIAALAFMAAGSTVAAGPGAGTAQEQAPPGQATAGQGTSDQGAADESAAVNTRLRELEEEIARLQAVIAALQAEAARGSGAPPAAPIEELQKRVEALSREIEKLRGQEEPAAETRSYGGLDPGASRVYYARRGLVFGGYGSGLYQNFTRTQDDDVVVDPVDRASLTEAFIYVGYRFDDRFVFNASFGIEDAVVESGSQGKATVEFAYVDFRANKYLGVRGGLVLLPLGFLNERHEPASYLGVRRPEVETRIIPTTWREIGGGLYGDAGPVQWRAYAVVSLDAAGFDAHSGVAGGRQQGSDSKATDVGVTARVDWSVLRNKMPGALLAGTSGFTGRTGQENPGFPPGRFSLWEAHLEYRWRGLQARVVYAQGIQSDAEQISLALDPSGATAVGERLRGWYMEAGYDVMTFVKSSRQEVTPFCRYEDLDTQDRTAPGTTADPANDLTLRTCGVRYRPIPGVVLKAEAQNFDQQDHKAVDQINLGLGWAF